MSANFTPEQEEMKNLQPFKFWSITNFPFIADDFDQITYYEILCKIVDYINKIIENNKALIDNDNALYKAYIELQNYVNDYFTNLNVQTEINNKLDEMVESGYFDNFLSNYLSLIKVYDTTTAMIEDAENLVTGEKIHTYGYYAINDGGSADFVISNTESSTVYQITLGDNLFANLIVKDNTINVKQIGCYEDNTHDDSDLLQGLLDFSEQYTGFTVLGNNKALKITKSLIIPCYTNFHNFYINCHSGTYGDYAIYTNVSTTSSTTWKVTYPRENIATIKNVRIFNVSGSTLNGFYNASNNGFVNIDASGFDIFFASTGDYLDSWYLDNWHTASKIESDNYAIYTGYLGDNNYIKNSHFNTTGNAITIANAHNTFTMDNIICHGNILISGGTNSISNIHMENGQITITGGACTTIDTAYLWHKDPNIIIDGANVTLKNIKFVYRMYHLSYETSEDLDVQILSGEVIVENCCKQITTTSIGENIKASIKTNVDNDIPTNAISKKYYVQNGNYSQWNKKTLTNLYAYNGNMASPTTAQTKTKWYGSTGTYCYKAVKIVDFERKISTDDTHIVANSVSLTNLGNGFCFLTSTALKNWKIYRGSSEGNYNAEVNISSISGGNIIDNFYMCNGNKWKARTSGDIDSFNYIASPILYYNENETIVLRNSETPTYGTWKQGDIIYNTLAYQSGQPKGWVCIQAGTPGLWDAF